MTKPRKYTYRIQYIDNTYQIVDLTKPEFKKLGQDMKSSQEFSVLEDVIFRLKDVRTIVFIPDPIEPTKEQTEQENQMTEWGFTDPATREWLVANGIDVSKVVEN